MIKYGYRSTDLPEGHRGMLCDLFHVCSSSTELMSSSNPMYGFITHNIYGQDQNVIVFLSQINNNKPVMNGELNNCVLRE